MSEEGSDDSPPRPKRKIKRVVIMSSSDSESDESVTVAGTRRKRLRVLSDEEASDSSGSSVVIADTRRRRTLPKLRDSDVESDSSSWDEAAKPVPSGPKPVSGFASDSSEGNSDKCSICLLRFKDQQVGTPESCEHIFCLDCITEWSKNVNTCPVDRITFNSIVVKACAGGRVLRTEPVKVIERTPSIELQEIVEDPTVCEICGSSEDEETMLLCDGCDLGYHMQCLSPPLFEIPLTQWYCPNCIGTHSAEIDLLDDINLSEVEDLFEGVNDIDLPLGPRSVPLRQPRNVRRSARNTSQSDQPSTSSGHRGNSININELRITLRGSRSTQRGTTRASNRRQAVTKRRKYKRRRTKTVIIEYEVQENGKFPVTKRVKKKVKRRRIKKRQPRTAARRSYVRASVQAKLASQRTDQRVDLAQISNASAGVVELSVRRQRAGIPSLSLLGNPNELVYFSDEDNTISEGATTAVATRPTSNILSAYRQARRKMITVPSPPHASSAPDILSNILESQTLLHSKKSIISISVDGSVDYKLTQTQKQDQQNKNALESKSEDKLDLSKANEAVKKAPSYPGQNRGGGGGWGGGYRGNYHREQNSNNFNNRGGNYDNNYGGGYQNRQNNSYNNYQNNNNMRREDTEYFSRRQQQYTPNEDPYFDRTRRPGPMENNRGTNYSNHQRPNDQNQSQSRYSLGPSWQPYGGGGHPGHPMPTPRNDLPPAPSRHSFGGFENPVDMRMGQIPPINTNINTETFPGIEASRQEKSQPQPYQSLPESQAYQPLPEAPVFNFQKISEVEKSEDEKSDSGLIIDTEKYDPTEPTNDDDSGEEDRISSQTVPRSSLPLPAPATTADFVPPALPASVPALPAPPPPPPAVQSILAGIDTSAMNVPPNVLDTAVRQVLKEHRNLIAPTSVDSRNDRSDEDSDGDCPNFSIYSATSVHIANNSSSLADELPNEQPQDSLEDLVQEDDETPPSTSPVAMLDHVINEKKSDISRTPSKSLYSNYESEEKKKSEEEYKEKVSKRCPITTNTRNPIKIKLNTPSLIKRQVTLYDDEETSQEVEPNDNLEVNADISEDKLKSNNSSPEYPQTPEKSDDKVELKENIDKIDKSASPNPKTENIMDKSNSEEKPEDIITKTVDSIVNTEGLCKNEQEAKTEKLESKVDYEKSVEKMDILGDKEETANDENSEGENEVPMSVTSRSPDYDDNARGDDNIEKMTESISETEDERSYTPCLDENKSNKDASFENDKDKGLEGLDTEMISEEEGNEMFSENERPPSETSHTSPPRAKVESEEGEIADKKKEGKKTSTREEGTKKKKKKDSKKEGKDKTKSKKRGEISFKKLSKSGKERNYRERDKNERRSERERRDSADANESRQRRRKEKRKDLERYDVRTVVTEKRRKQKDPFGRDVSPRGRSPSLSPPARSPSRRRSPSPARRRSLSPRRSLSRHRRDPSRRRSASRRRRSPSRPPSRIRRSLSRGRRSVSRGRRSPSRPRRSPSPLRRSHSRARRSPPPRRSISRRVSAPRGRSPSRPRASPARAPAPAPRARRSASTPRRRSGTPRLSPRRRSSPRRKRRRSGSRPARRRSASASPPRRVGKKKKRAARRAPDPSPKAKRRRSASGQPEPTPPSPMSRPPSPRTPPPEVAREPREDEPERRERRRREPERQRRRPRDALGPSKEVFTSGDNILVSVSFKDQERGEDGDRRRRRESRRERRRRRRAAVAPDVETAKPVAIIDLERSPFRELTPSPKNVIVLSDSEPGERDASAPAPAAAAEPAPEPAPALGPKTPPEPEAPPAAAAEPERADERAAAEDSEPPSPDAYDPFEPTRSPSASPAPAPPAAPAAPSPPRALITLEAAQRSNLSADEVLDRRPLTPVEKVMALLQSTRDASPEPAEAEAPVAPRIVLPSPTRAAAKLFPGKPSPIKSNPVKPMQALRPRVPSDAGASPYSPGSSDFGELFEPPRRQRQPTKLPQRLDRKRGKTTVGVKLDDDNLKILDDLPNSAVEMQVKNKFLRKLNRQERVVEEVKLVLKPHYNKKRVTKDEYKDILRRAVPKICHNKSGEINPTKIQALVEAYVRKFRKKHKLGIA